MDGTLKVIHSGQKVFPTLDFKFQNTGNATAVLWKFSLIVEDAAIDPAPDLSATISVGDECNRGLRGFGTRPGRYLFVTLRNNGWGPALNGNFVLSGARLDCLVEASKRTLVSEIPDGESVVLVVDSSLIGSARLTSLRDALKIEAERDFEAELPRAFLDWLEREKCRRQIQNDQNDNKMTLEKFKMKYGRLPMPADFTSECWRKSAQARDSHVSIDIATERENFEKGRRAEFQRAWAPASAVPLGGIAVRYNVSDRWGRSHTGTIQPDMGGNIGGSLAVGPAGFVHEEHYALLHASIPDTVYCCIVDPDRGAHSREYNISRQVLPGDAEHFQIVVGTTKSAYLKVKFRFHVDKSESIESESFEMELWNPRHMALHTNFLDVDAARTRLDELKMRSKSNRDSWSDYVLERNADIIASFPFGQRTRELAHD